MSRETAQMTIVVIVSIVVIRGMYLKIVLSQEKVHALTVENLGIWRKNAQREKKDVIIVVV